MFESQMKAALRDTPPVRVGVVLTMAELYRRNRPEAVAAFAVHWRTQLESILSPGPVLLWSAPACTDAEFAECVREHEAKGADMLLVLPMAYTPSLVARDALTRTTLPVVLVSSARDSTLPVEMDGDHLLANQAVHGVQDLANVLWRAGRPFELIAGHPSQPAFRDELGACVRVAGAARILQRGRVGQIGGSLDGMLDFTFEESTRERLGFAVEAVDVRHVLQLAERMEPVAVADYVECMRAGFEIDADITVDELEACARGSLAMEALVAEKDLDAVALNFMALLTNGAPTLPFVGACRLMAGGIGYAGEGDAVTALLVAALWRLDAHAGFTEIYAPDYERGEILLSHMGESNPALAAADTPLRLRPRAFAWGDCGRVLAPVFQMRPGPVTLVAVTETPGPEGDRRFRLVTFPGEIVRTPPHPNLLVPSARLRAPGALRDFLRAYSRAGGPHHLGVIYGDHRPELESLARLLDLDHVAIAP